MKVLYYIYLSAACLCFSAYVFLFRENGYIKAIGIDKVTGETFCLRENIVTDWMLGGACLTLLIGIWILLYALTRYIKSRGIVA